MSQLISKWPGRLVSLLVPAALIVSFFAPTSVLAKKEMSLGGGGTSDSEGDPLDTNDFSGGGGGGGTDIQDTAAPAGSDGFWILGMDSFQVLLVPEVLGGVLIFKIVLVEKSDLGPIYDGMEGYHAP